MPINKVERQMNLVICLLATRQFLTAEQLRTSVAGYADSTNDEAFNRMLERDKSELRQLGIPLETGRNSSFDTIDGYRIDRVAYELPDIDLTPEESLVITLAAAVWDAPEVSATTRNALLKLRAAGIELDTESAAAITASPVTTGAHNLLGDQASLLSIMTAIEQGKAISFDHQAGRTKVPTMRTVEPWGVVTHQARWYLVGHDRDRAAIRTFRISRIVGEIKHLGSGGTLARPTDLNLKEIVEKAVGAAGETGGVATVWVAAGKATGLRRRALTETIGDELVDTDFIPTRPGSYLTIPIDTLSATARRITEYGIDARVVAPQELIDVVIVYLETLALPLLDVDAVGGTQ